MSKILIQDAFKKYGNTTVIQGLNAEIPEGALFTLLGPSGCGKTTLLRMIAGFTSIEGGNFFFDNTCINNLDPSKRNIGMVFQDYAVFPHLSVEENVKFGLKQRKLSREEMQIRTNHFLSLMQIEQYRKRMPAQLSGGQQQRVALARALAIQPDVLLMDEPLSNLDAKLRVDMRKAIRKIQKDVNITTVYVTHDQEEAMAISDYIAVMKDGKIQHLGTAHDIYCRPKNLFVATFIGRSNIISGKVDNGMLIISGKEIMKLAVPNQKVHVSVRPEEFILSNTGIPVTIIEKTFLGAQTHYTVSFADGTEAEITAESNAETSLEEEKPVHLSIKTKKINVFTEDGTVNLVQNI